MEILLIIIVLEILLGRNTARVAPMVSGERWLENAV